MRFLVCLLLCGWLLPGAAYPALGSNRVKGRPVFPTMDYTLTKLGDTATRVVFHTTYNAADGSGVIPFLGYTIDSVEQWLRVTAWYDIRDAKDARPVERHDTVYFRNAGGPDSVRLVSATIYRDSLEYPFSRNDWNIADSLYFFSKETDSNAPPQMARLRVRPVTGRRELRTENPDRLPLSGLELLDGKGKLLRKMPAATTSFPTKGLSPGLYFLRFRSPYGNRVELVIQNP